MPPTSPSAWRVPIALFTAGVIALLLVYRETAASFPRVWSHSDTYTHCFFVLPVCGWLVWRKRDVLRALTPAPEPWGLLLLAGAGLLWLLADAVNVLIYAQLGLAAMIPALAFTLFGRRVARALTYPFAFFFLAVPFGEVIQPWLMQLTAKFTAAGLRLTGIPVHVEGLFLTTPNSRWRVIEACSGLRFLISMFTLGTLFAYLRFHRPGTRLLFGALSIAMPLVANGLRAYTMVLVGYLSDMKVGVGLDHYAIGWALFALVMAVFFFVGSRWREAPVETMASGPGEGAEPAPASSGRAPSVRAAIAAGTAALLLVIAPWAVARGLPSADRADAPPLAAPAAAPGWMEQETLAPWRPSFRGTTDEVRVSFASGDSLVDVYVGFYRSQRQGAELIHFENVVVPRNDETWRTVSEGSRSVVAGSERLEVRETLVRSEIERYVVWSWYWLPDTFTSSQVAAKLLQARARILYRRDHAAVVILSAPYETDPETARARLRAFVSDMLSSVRESLRRADGAPRAS
ncbi:MAG TPA: exosortase A [Acidobacteriota bacterium]|nr:exosortase A [Acidobacteriota bacterium]